MVIIRNAQSIMNLEAIRQKSKILQDEHYLKESINRLLNHQHPTAKISSIHSDWRSSFFLTHAWASSALRELPNHIPVFTNAAFCDSWSTSAPNVVFVHLNNNQMLQTSLNNTWFKNCKNHKSVIKLHMQKPDWKRKNK